MNAQAAIDLVASQGDVIEQARLRYLLYGEHPSPEVVHALQDGQRTDGGWSAFWGPGYSSLDATCFRLAQAEELEITESGVAIRRALNFLAQRQREDGSWEEEPQVVDIAPSWAKPGDLAARLYLTANCGFWLAIFDPDLSNASLAATYLLSYPNEKGQLPTFVHAHWLAGGLWYRLQRRKAAERSFDYLKLQLPALPASNLAWMITTLLLAGIPFHEHLIEKAASRLEQEQKQDGRWLSEDGSGRDIHATLEALRALRLCGRF